MSSEQIAVLRGVYEMVYGHECSFKGFVSEIEGIILDAQSPQTADDGCSGEFEVGLAAVRAILTDSKVEHLAVRLNNACIFIDAALKQA